LTTVTIEAKMLKINVLFSARAKIGFRFSIEQKNEIKNFLLMIFAVQSTKIVSGRTAKMEFKETQKFPEM
jgi:hypothetical protein